MVFEESFSDRRYPSIKHGSYTFTFSLNRSHIGNLRILQARFLKVDPAEHIAPEIHKFPRLDAPHREYNTTYRMHGWQML